MDIGAAAQQRIGRTALALTFVLLAACAEGKGKAELCNSVATRHPAEGGANASWPLQRSGFVVLQISGKGQMSPRRTASTAASAREVT